MYTGFLVRVLFTSTFSVAVGPTSRSDVLVVIGGLMSGAESGVTSTDIM